MILIVGSGFSGCVLARELAEAGHSVTIIDKRNHIGGNAFDFINEKSIRVHKYGPHLFHTNNKNVFEYLSKFTDWVPYQHKVKALLNDGSYVTLPVNKFTKAMVGIENIVETFFRPYSEKMWGMKLEELDPDIINRVPIRDDDNELYFPNDKYQCLPKNGYTKLFENILDHKNISIQINTSFDKAMESQFKHIFNSMPIDEYYNYCFGELPYRSIKFHDVHIPAPKLLPVSVVNFTHKSKYTRVVEWKHLPTHECNLDWTTLTYEEPCDYKENNFERYYPVKDIKGKNRELYQKYASIKNERITFVGRLGMYVYLDMHQCVSSSLAIVKHYLTKS